MIWPAWKHAAAPRVRSKVNVLGRTKATMGIFSEAYQRTTGGNLTGQAALAALLEAVPKGTVKSNDILPAVAQIMSERAAPKLDIAMQTSQAWQGRFQNARSDWTRTFSESGGEAGYRNVFRGFTGFMESFPEIPESTARRFESIANSMSAIMLAPGSFRAALKGEDSLIGDWLGEDVIERARTNIEDILGFVQKIQNLLPARSQGVDEAGTPYAGGLPIIGRISKAWTNTIDLAGSFSRINSASDLPQFGGAAVEATLGTAYTALTGRQSLLGDLGNNAKYGSQLVTEQWDSFNDYGRQQEGVWRGMQYESPTRERPNISVNQLTIEVEAREAESPRELVDRIYDNFRSTILNFGDN